MRRRSGRVVSRLMLTLIAGLLLVLVVHVAAVHVARHQLEQLLHPQPGAGTYLGDVHLNLFTGLLAVEGLELGPRGAPYLQLSHLLLDIDMAQLLRGTVQVERLDAVAGTWRMQRRADGSIDTGLPAFAEASDTDEAVPLALPLVLQQAAIKRFRVVYADPQALPEPQTLRVRSLQVRDVALGSDQAATLQAQLQWGDSRVEFDGEFLPSATAQVKGRLQLRALPLQQVLRLARQPVDLAGRLGSTLQVDLHDRQLRLAGSLQLGDFAFNQQALGVQLAQLAVADARLSLPLDDPQQALISTGPLSIEQLALGQDQMQLQLPAASTEGRWQVDLAAETFSLEQLLLSLQQPALQQGAGSLSAEQIQVKLNAANSALAAPALQAGQFALRRLALQHAALGKDRLLLDQVKAPGLSLQAQTVQFGQLRVDGIALQDFPFKLASLSLGESSIGAERIDLGHLLIDGLDTRLQRGADGKWQLPVLAADGDAASASGEAPPISLAGVSLQGSNRVHLFDNSIKPAIDKKIVIERLELGAVDSRSPNADSQLALLLKPDDYTALKLDARLRPFAQPFYIDAEGELSGMELAVVNGLVADALGHRFLAGQLDDTFSIRIEQQHLKMENALHLQDLDVEEISGKQGPPLATAIALLEDKNGIIELGVPVEGDLNNPDFKVLAALNPIIFKAVAGAASLAIQPLGSVLLVGSLLADQALQVSFDPALFEPKTAGFSAGAADKVRQLAAKLKDKPKLRLRLCGIAAEADRSTNKKGEYLEPEQQLLQLADLRVAMVRSLMLGEGVAEDQLRSCRPKLDDKPDGLPRVDIRL